MNAIWEDIINFLSYSVKHYNTIILSMINSEDKGHAMNEVYVKAHECEIRILVFGVSATEEPILDIGPRFMTIVIVIVT